jgi:hypothetical protein
MGYRWVKRISIGSRRVRGTAQQQKTISLDVKAVYARTYVRTGARTKTESSGV